MKYIRTAIAAGTAALPKELKVQYIDFSGNTPEEVLKEIIENFAMTLGTLEAKQPSNEIAKDIIARTIKLFDDKIDND